MLKATELTNHFLTHFTISSLMVGTSPSPLYWTKTYACGSILSHSVQPAKLFVSIFSQNFSTSPLFLLFAFSSSPMDARCGAHRVRAAHDAGAFLAAQRLALSSGSGKKTFFFHETWSFQWQKLVKRFCFNSACEFGLERY
jgi:hypothetical protein